MAPEMITLNKTFFGRSEIQIPVHSLTILSFLQAAIWLKPLYFMQYYGDISGLLEIHSATGRDVQDNRWCATRKSLNHAQYFLMSGYRTERAETW